MGKAGPAGDGVLTPAVCRGTPVCTHKVLSGCRCNSLEYHNSSSSVVPSGAEVAADPPVWLTALGQLLGRVRQEFQARASLPRATLSADPPFSTRQPQAVHLPRGRKAPCDSLAETFSEFVVCRVNPKAVGLKALSTLAPDSFSHLLSRHFYPRRRSLGGWRSTPQLSCSLCSLPGVAAP